MCSSASGRVMGSSAGKAAARIAVRVPPGLSGNSDPASIGAIP